VSGKRTRVQLTGGCSFDDRSYTSKKQNRESTPTFARRTVQGSGHWCVGWIGADSAFCVSLSILDGGAPDSKQHCTPDARIHADHTALLCFAPHILHHL